MENEKVISEPKNIPSITGVLSPFHLNDQPWTVKLPNNSSEWIVVFNNEDDLKTFCEDANITEYKIKQVTDGRDFTDSIKSAGLRIMLNPRKTAENKTRWTEIYG